MKVHVPTAVWNFHIGGDQVYQSPDDLVAVSKDLDT